MKSPLSPAGRLGASVRTYSSSTPTAAPTAESGPNRVAGMIAALAPPSGRSAMGGLAAAIRGRSATAVAVPAPLVEEARDRPSFWRSSIGRGRGGGAFRFLLLTHGSPSRATAVACVTHHGTECGG